MNFQKTLTKIARASCLVSSISSVSCTTVPDNLSHVNSQESQAEDRRTSNAMSAAAEEKVHQYPIPRISKADYMKAKALITKLNNTTIDDVNSYMTASNQCQAMIYAYEKSNTGYYSSAYLANRNFLVALFYSGRMNNKQAQDYDSSLHVPIPIRYEPESSSNQTVATSNSTYTPSYSPTTTTSSYTSSNDEEPPASSQADQISNAYTQNANAAKAARDESYESDVVNWIQINPSSISTRYYGGIDFDVNLIGSPVRRGRVRVRQIDGFQVGTVWEKTLPYRPGQNHVEGTLRIVPFPSGGNITIEASVVNYYDADTTATAILSIR